MAGFQLTPNQKKAVEDRSGTLLVAAAAGSGKTAILTQRLISRLCSPDEVGDISEFLVVTFTKAATGELRARLFKELSEFVKNNPSNKRARRQLSLIGLAKISTIHSFCLDIISSNFETLSLPSILRMGEETEVNVLLKNTLDSIISERYDNSDDNSLFLKAVEILSTSKSDDKFSESILDLYKKLRGISDYEQKFRSYLDKYSEVESADEIFDTEFGKLIKEDILYETSKVIYDFECLLSEIATEPDAYTVMYQAVSADCETLENIKNALSEGYEIAKIASDSFAAARCKNVPKDCACKEYIDELKDHRTKCNGRIKGILKKYLGADAQTVRNAAKESRQVLEEIFSVITELDRKFSEKKLERGILDFSDLEQYTLKLLVKDTGEFSGKFERTALAESISANYREIYIDEYQDTNSIQDMIFRAISTYDADKNTETNRFLVGDVKQSIYRFRGAQPDIFSSYIKLFEDINNNTANQVTTHKLYLSNNFRCSENVINATNRVFFKIMDDYTVDDSLIYSKNESCKVTAPSELVLVNSASDSSPMTEEKLSDEALYIASRIQEMAYNPNILNEKGNMYRFSDFAILHRSANSLSEPFRRAFRKMNVPFSSDTPEDFFSLPEVLLALCLFNCVDNPQRDIFTAGLMYSPIYNFTADELVKIRSCDRQTSFFSCTEIYSETASDCALKDKVCSFLSEIKEFRKKSRGTPTDLLISEMFDKTGMYDIYRNSPEKRRNIRNIYEMARNFEKTSFRGLSAFLEYLEDLANGTSDSRAVSDSDSVKFMSIHRSKGLEFPVVFLAGTMREFNTSDEKTPVIFSSKHGIGIKLRDTPDTAVTTTRRNFSAINTPFREAIRSTERIAMLEEEKRLLYVAMTRARDRLIMTAVTKDYHRTIRNASIRREGGFDSYGKYAMCYFDFIYHSLTDKEFYDLQKTESDNCDSCLKCFTVNASNEYFDSIRNSYKNTAITNSTDEIDSEDYSKLLKKIKEKKAYKSSLSNISAKISVSQLKKGLLDDEQKVNMKVTLKAMPRFMSNTTEADGAEKGTAAHIFMQFADFDLLEKYGAAREADRLLENGFITNRMRSIVELDVLNKFIESNLYKDIKGASKLYRERRFNLRLPASEFTENVDLRLADEFILVQGVSDLYFENSDGTLTLVDFKTDKVSEIGGEATLLARHTEQLGYYKRAIEEITGKAVSKVYIYSFALSREIKVNI